ncbi:putative PHD finger protein [Ixodes scapularis]
MPDDARLKSSTRQAFGRKRKRPWNKKLKLSAASAPPRSAPPDALDLPETSAGGIATPCSSGSLLNFASAVRVDTAYYSTAEQAQRVARSDECKRALSEKSATQRKFDLGVTTGGQTRDAGTQFIVVDMKALKAWRKTICVCWLASVVALQASIARHLAHRQRLHQGHALNGDATLGKEDAWPGKGDPALPGGCPPKGPPHGGTPRPHRTSPHSGKGSPKNGPLSPAMAGLSGSLQAYVDGVGEGDLGKLDERLVRILAWQRLQQLLPPPRRPNGLVRNSGPVTEVRARAVVCPVGGRGSPVPMSFRTLTMGSGADMDVCLSHFGHCNFVSSKHACIFYDEMSKHYELLNYSEHGTSVDNVLYSCDFSDKRSPLPPASAAVAALRGCLKGARGDHRMSATPQPQARRPCGCRSSGSSLIGGAGWEGTALLHHGSHLRLGCLQFVFSVTQEEPWP